MVITAIVIFIIGIQYAFNAWKRETAKECISVTSHSGLYRAESCVTGGDGNLLFYVGKLYTTRGGAPVARVSFDSMEGGQPEFMFDDSAVLFEGANGDSGQIKIPPTFLDRLRASVP
ncbi:hypothetical protein [Paraburkholderia sp. J63]|uniref:hypothetical protein n=1 Tax=Paraburkholderia sp. J63 TaxID=2805434 RepID=UPI002ABE8CB8|nr:hypothetical protein [Paraburkholderia sp. J63]